MELDREVYEFDAFVNIAHSSDNPTVISALDALKTAVAIAHPGDVEDMASSTCFELNSPRSNEEYHTMVDLTLEIKFGSAMFALENFYEIASGIRAKN